MNTKNKAEAAPATSVRKRLEYLRGELRAERISYGELNELQSIAKHIAPGDVELLEAAGVPEQTPAQCGQHTPGPWIYDGCLNGQDLIIHVDYGRSDLNSFAMNGLAGYVATVKTKEIGMNLPGTEAESNARLIAAAPELLEALKILVQSPEIRQEDMQQARAAIAKASH